MFSLVPRAYTTPSGFSPTNDDPSPSRPRARGAFIMPMDMPHGPRCPSGPDRWRRCLPWRRNAVQCTPILGAFPSSSSSPPRPIPPQLFRAATRQPDHLARASGERRTREQPTRGSTSWVRGGGRAAAEGGSTRRRRERQHECPVDDRRRQRHAEHITLDQAEPEKTPRARQEPIQRLSGGGVTSRKRADKSSAFRRNRGALIGPSPPAERPRRQIALSSPTAVSLLATEPRSP